jgi:hypothetical protein
MLLLLCFLPTFALLGVVCHMPPKAKKQSKAKALSKKEAKGKNKASPCEKVIGKLNYAITSAKDAESKSSAEERLGKYKSMSNQHKGEFAALYDVNNGSVTWQADYLDKHSSFSREALKFEEGWMTRNFVRP